MAEGPSSAYVKEQTSNLKESLNDDECAVCLQTMQHPARLPCSHIFCYLCIKGIVNQGGRCALCRKPISPEYLDNPQLLQPLDLECLEPGEQFQWFYEGHSGWWQYDERTSGELEAALKKGEKSCHILVAGFVYVADFESMVQYRRCNPGRRRRIKRDISVSEVKGVAGIRIPRSAAGSACPLISSTSQHRHPDIRDLIARTQDLNLNDDFDMEVIEIESDHPPEIPVRMRRVRSISLPIYESDDLPLGDNNYVIDGDQRNGRSRRGTDRTRDNRTFR